MNGSVQIERLSGPFMILSIVRVKLPMDCSKFKIRASSLYKSSKKSIKYINDK
jgi:hypothetical protein